MPADDVRRDVLKADVWEELRDVPSDQRRGLPRPPLQQPYPKGAPLIDLPVPRRLDVAPVSLFTALRERKSHRAYSAAPLSLEELAFLLWATQGVRRLMRGDRALFRTVPSAGARHPFETYLVLNRVEGIEAGLYRYLSLDHRLCCLRTGAHLAERVARACHHQTFVAQSAVTFVWTAIPYRTEWRYGKAAPKLIALDAGHVCQNLYLACTAVGAGTCAIAAYNQRELDALLGVDGEEEFAVYVAPVGKLPSGR
ncbi:MAG: SagB/ThcOx family dehydrogenase [Anaerolineae bacterium]